MEDLGYVGDPAQATLYAETVPALKRLSDYFVLFIVTNQNGISKGVLRHEDVAKVNARIVQTVAEDGISIREVYCCPHDRSDACVCAKPQAYFGLRAHREHDIDLKRSFVVGDHPSDMEFASNIGAKGVYVLSGHGKKHREELKVPCSVVEDIEAAVEVVSIERAADELRVGRLVGFPTETVYGLGADAENEVAVRRIFEIKGRPMNHPLIVHSVEPWQWTEKPTEDALRLAEVFWPGPLTLILKRNARVCDAVTGGQGTVGIRVPSHAAALAMLAKFGGGVAAPSANRFGKVSPTTARHVRDDLGSAVDFILDGGECDVGVESTIVDLSGKEPVILRPGGATRESIEQALGRPVAVARESVVRAPGRHASHYAPRAKVIMARPEEIDARAAELRAKGFQVDVLANPEARGLYAWLRAADARGSDAVIVVVQADQGLGLAINDRLLKASRSA